MANLLNWFLGTKFSLNVSIQHIQSTKGNQKWEIKTAQIQCVFVPIFHTLSQYTKAFKCEHHQSLSFTLFWVICTLTSRSTSFAIKPSWTYQSDGETWVSWASWCRWLDRCCALCWADLMPSRLVHASQGEGIISFSCYLDISILYLISSMGTWNNKSIIIFTKIFVLFVMNGPAKLLGHILMNMGMYKVRDSFFHWPIKVGVQISLAPSKTTAELSTLINIFDVFCTLKL